MSAGAGKRQRPPVRPIAVMLVMLILGALPLSGSARQDATGATLIGAFDVGPGGCPECANPLTNGGGFTWYEKYFSKLMLYDVNFTAIQGELAETWEVNADATQYTVNLRSGVTWHDGEPFTSADVKFTIELAAHPDSQSIYGAKFLDVASIDTPDELTVVLNLSKSNATLLDAFTFLVMLPKHALEAIAPADLVASEWWLSTPIGTGPFKWSVYEPGQYIELVAFDDYWRGRPKLDKLINRFFPEAGSAVIALRSGEIAFTYLSADEARSLEGEEAINVIAGPSQVLNHLDFDLTEERFQDVRIRQAFLYAIDRPLIIEELYLGTATAVPCAYLLDQYIPDGLNDYAYNPDMARQLLTEAGWDSSQTVEIVTYYGDQLSQDVLVTIQQMLADVGVNVTLRTVDVPTINQIGADPTQWEMMFAGAANGPDPDVMATHFQSKASNPSVRNWSSIDDPRVDELLALGRAETDPAARAEVYQQLCAHMNEQVHWMSLWVPTRFGGASIAIQDFVWTPAPGGGRYYDAAETWSVTE